MRRFSFTKILGVILALALVVCIASGLVTRFSYTDTVAQTSRSGRAFLAFPKSGPSDDEIDMIMQSVLQAELIARVKCLESRPEYLTTKATLQVLEVYRGNIEADTMIDFYESNYIDFYANGTPAYFDHSYFNLMQDNEEYIVFANQKIYHPVYQESLKRSVYIPACFELSWFSPQMTQPSILDKKDVLYQKISYFKMKDEEFICFSKEQRNKINQLKKSILEKIG